MKVGLPDKSVRMTSVLIKCRQAEWCQLRVRPAIRDADEQVGSACIAMQQHVKQRQYGHKRRGLCMAE